MFKRLLKLLSGLTLFWMGRPRVPAPPPPERRADYRVCDTCGTFLRGDSSRFTCRECAADRVRHGPRPARVNRIPGGAELSLPMSCHVAPGGETPRIMVRLASWQAEVLSRTLLKPGSANLDIERGGNGMTLAASWRLPDKVRITVWTGDKRDADLSLTAAQAGRLGEDIAGCLGIIFTDAPVCHHEFVGGGPCVICGAVSVT